MNAQPYLMFNLNHSRYGIPANAVQEIFFLPEVTAISDIAAAILGVINLRGSLLPVIDLYQRLGRVRPPLQLTDTIIVLAGQTQQAGMVVNQVEGVQTITADQIAPTMYIQLDVPEGLVTGIATLEDGIVTLLNPDLLIQQTAVPSLASVTDAALNQTLYDHFGPQARQVLRERTAALQAAIADEDATGMLPLAVVGLAGEYFGFELGTVYEFTEIHKITPIPCCPPHIIGNINLRGEIITLINISNVIDLPMNAVRSRPQAVVVRLGQRVAGIAVDDIFDVTHIHPSQITPVPIAIQSTRDDYLRGVAPYDDRMMGIIDLPKLLTSDVLVVNEEV